MRHFSSITLFVVLPSLSVLDVLLLGVLRLSRRWTGTFSFQQGGKPRDLLFLVTLVYWLSSFFLGEEESDWCSSDLCGSLFSLEGGLWEVWRSRFGFLQALVRSTLLRRITCGCLDCLGSGLASLPLLHIHHWHVHFFRGRPEETDWETCISWSWCPMCFIQLQTALLELDA